MLTFLDIINRMLGYFNIQDRPKGQVFTVVAFIANFYLLYIAIQNLRYAGFRIRGALFLLAFIALLYFIILNFIYFFTNKKAPFDISPKIEKMLGGNQAQKKAAEQALAAQTQASPASGVFAEDKILPATTTISEDQQANLDQLVTDLVTQGAMALNYQGLDDAALARVATQTQQPVLAMGGPVELPFFSLQPTGDQLVVMGGLNALSAQPLGTIDSIGLMPVATAQAQYDFAVAHAYVTGGEAKRLGRSGLMTIKQPYTLTVQVAYQEKP